ncbi:MAG: helix-turn-helix domain-containing protein [Clostridiales bacterium]
MAAAEQLVFLSIYGVGGDMEMDNRFNSFKGECDCCDQPRENRGALCPVCITQKVFRGKWKLMIVWQLKDGEKRFSQLQKTIPATQASLTKQLRELEGDGILNRKVFDIIPPRVEYSLTAEGHSFLAVMEEMHNWGQTYLSVRFP